MAAENLTATRRGSNAVVGNGIASNVKALVSTVEVTASASVGSTYALGNIPSNARLLGVSNVYIDALATTGSPTIDIGLFAVDSNVTSDADALNDGIDATAAGTSTVIKDRVNYGLPAWDHVSGQSSDPGGELQVKITLADADVTAGGTITAELLYIID